MSAGILGAKRAEWEKFKLSRPETLAMQESLRAIKHSTDYIFSINFWCMFEYVQFSAVSWAWMLGVSKEHKTLIRKTSREIGNVVAVLCDVREILIDWTQEFEEIRRITTPWPPWGFSHFFHQHIFCHFQIHEIQSLRDQWVVILLMELERHDYKTTHTVSISFGLEWIKMAHSIIFGSLVFETTNLISRQSITFVLKLVGEDNNNRIHAAEQAARHIIDGVDIGMMKYVLREGRGAMLVLTSHCVDSSSIPLLVLNSHLGIGACWSWSIIPARNIEGSIRLREATSGISWRANHFHFRPLLQPCQWQESTFRISQFLWFFHVSIFWFFL